MVKNRIKEGFTIKKTEKKRRKHFIVFDPLNPEFKKIVKAFTAQQARMFIWKEYFAGSELMLRLEVAEVERVKTPAEVQLQLRW